MKLLTSSLFLLLLSVAAKCNAQKPTTFEKYHEKALSSAPVSLTDASFDELAGRPRNHSIALCLTALDKRHNCQMCHVFKPEWDALAKSWTKGDKKGEGKLVFATLDFLVGKQTFQSLRTETAPVVLFFPPTVGPKARLSGDPYKFDFTTGPPTAEQLHSWIAKHMPDTAPKPRFSRPPNYVRIIAITVFGLGALTATVVAWPYVQTFVQSRNLWAAGCLIAILLFTSGHMFNHIRAAPYAAPGPNGMTYFAAGFQNQYGIESQIIAAIYAILSFGTLALALKVPRMQNPKVQQTAVLIWSAVVYFVYGFLLSIFRGKNQGYPFKLPPL